MLYCGCGSNDGGVLERKMSDQGLNFALNINTIFKRNLLGSEH